MLQQLINGLSLGSIYALIALGYGLVYGVLRFINFSHGDVFMVGAFVAFFSAPLATRFLGSGWLTFAAVLFISILFCAALGAVIERVAYRPLRNRPKLTMLITSIGVSLLLEYGGQLWLGPDPRAFPTLIPNRLILNTPTLVLGQVPVIVMGFSILLMGLMYLVVQRSRLGIALRAVSQNQAAASLMGVSINRMVMQTFAIGAGLAGAGGVFYALLYPSINPLMGIFPGLKAFVAVVFGGIGSIPGALIGGMVIGILETFVTAYLSPTYRDAIAFVILIAVLLFRPAGLFGQSDREKV